MVALGAVGMAVVVALWLTLMVILAPPPPAAVAVPDLTGMTLEQAVGKLPDKQLTLGTVTKVDTPDGTARHGGQPTAVLADPGRPEHPGERGDRAALVIDRPLSRLGRRCRHSPREAATPRTSLADLFSKSSSCSDIGTSNIAATPDLFTSDGNDRQTSDSP